MMRHSILFTCAGGLALGMAGMAGADTLAEVKARDAVTCGVNIGQLGFSAPDAEGNWAGIDVSFCRALAAAVLGDPDKAQFVPLSSQNRFTALASGEVDVLPRNTSWTFQRENDLKFVFVGVNYYDGQGFMVPKSLGVDALTDLDGATVCIQSGTTTELNLADFFKQHGMSYQAVNVDTVAEGEQQFLAGACDAYTDDMTGLASTRAGFPDPDAYVLLPELISKEPLGPAVRYGDDQWASIARWTLFALIAAEEYGVTAANAEELATSTNNPEIQRLLGATDDLGLMFGLDAEWAKRAIMAEGNYGEIFSRHLGEQSEIGQPRGLNAQYTQGGLMYSPPFR